MSCIGRRGEESFRRSNSQVSIQFTRAVADWQYQFCSTCYQTAVLGRLYCVHVQALTDGRTQLWSVWRTHGTYETCFSQYSHSCPMYELIRLCCQSLNLTLWLHSDLSVWEGVSKNELYERVMSRARPYLSRRID